MSGLSLEKADKARIEKEPETEGYYRSFLNRVTIFPGSVEEYERFKGYRVAPCDTGSTQEGIILRTTREGRVVNNYDTELTRRLIGDGLEAIVEAKILHHPPDPHFAFYGLPVKKQNK